MPPNPNIPKSYYLARVFDKQDLKDKRGGFRIIFKIAADNKIVTGVGGGVSRAIQLGLKRGHECLVKVDNFEEKDAVKDVRAKPWQSRRDPEPVSVTEAAGEGTAGDEATGEGAAGNTGAAGKEGT